MTAAQKTAFRQLLAQGIPAQKTANRSVQQWIRLLIAAQRAADAHPYSIKDAQKLAQLQADLNAQFKNQPTLLAAINSVLGQYNQNLQSAAKNGQNMKVTLDQVQQGVTSLYDNLLQQNQQAMGTLTQGPWLQGPFMQAAEQFGFKPQPRDFLKDARMQLSQFRNFNHLLDSLRKRGAPEAMLQQLEQLGPGAIDQIRAITRMSQPELRKYFNVFRDQQAAIHKQTMKDLDNQLKDYLKYGRKVGLAMAAGIRQESPAITKAIDRAIRRAFGHIGSGMTGPGGGRNRRTSGGGNTTNNTTNVNVTTHKDASLDTKLRHARFKARQAHNHPGSGYRN
jgi:hypothetical protein